MMIWFLVFAYCLSRFMANGMQAEDKQRQSKTPQPSNHEYPRHTPFAQALLKCHSSQYPFVIISLFSVAETVKTWMAFENSFINSSVLHAPEQETLMLGRNRRTMSAIVQQLEDTKQYHN